MCVYLGNFGPEISETMIADWFQGPTMFCAAAEETQDNLIDGRGDAYCGMLNASQALSLRKTRAYIPEEPVGDAGQCAEMIHEFLPIARAIVGLQNLKIISFGPLLRLRRTQSSTCSRLSRSTLTIHALMLL